MELGAVLSSKLKKAALEAGVVGLAFGLVCGLADSLPGEGQLRAFLGWLGNVAGVWLLLAFIVGARAPALRSGILLAPLALALAVVTYYGYIILADTRPLVPTSHLLKIAAVWLAFSLAAGSVFGGLGAVWRAGHGRRPLVAVALLSGALAGENLFFVYRSWSYLASSLSFLFVLEFGLALLLPWLMLRRPRRALSATGMAAALAVVGLVIIGGVRSLLRGLGG